MDRPQPDLEMLDRPSAFYPDQNGLGEWARSTFIDEDGKLHNPAHAHLKTAFIGWLWTNAPNESRGRTIIGEARMIKPAGNRWSQSLGEWQLRRWFEAVPDFLIIISSDYARFCGDMEFCALIEHEMYHCAQDKDAFDMPRFNNEGRPIYIMRGHDVEEFVDVVARYGGDATQMDKMKEALDNGPTIGRANVVAACGTCNLKRAA